MGRALVRQPQVFLFDEPLSNLDAKLRVEMRTEIKRLHQAMKTTMVYVTHDQIEAMTLATQIAVMNAGEIQQLGTPQEIYNRPANTFVAGFMGSPSMNMVAATVDDGAGGPAVSLATTNGHALRLPLGPAAKALAGYGKREVILGLRPEAITDPNGADRSGNAIARADCLVEVVEPAGSDTFVVTRLADKEVIARMRADADVRPGQLAPFAFAMDKAVLFDPETGERIG
jgi:multiple sugar transport system ATP-binding protein